MSWLNKCPTQIDIVCMPVTDREKHALQQLLLLLQPHLLLLLLPAATLSCLLHQIAAEWRALASEERPIHIAFNLGFAITILIIIARLSTHCPRLPADCASLIRAQSWLLVGHFRGRTPHISSRYRVRHFANVVKAVPLPLLNQGSAYLERRSVANRIRA